MEKKISYAEAQKVRNRVKQKIIDIVDLYNRAPAEFIVGNDKDYYATGGKTITSILADYNVAEEILLELNLAMNEANMKGGQQIQLKLNAIADQRNFYDMPLHQARRFQRQRIEFNEVTGEKIPVNYESELDLASIEAIMKNLEKKKFEYENACAEFNAKTKVDLSGPVGSFSSLADAIDYLMNY